ncbi:MerR family transcriptional regulator [Pleionea sp. CnH1-48]|uniref:MerR family transcriptional regulator n=1 Tax=Pleionea sp. CnH1-48 TaxID=2954494 RepID=UPI002097FFFE|nr:MerR family transcriptional regulator [Pleionea sp. CnH1-48]MCO7224905.1 MerR family transcriptional regulator [Pleionea sp. CnH1-48]
MTLSTMDNELFPIRELSAKTHVNSVTLRAWERRYGLLKPKRTAKGHRLYSETDVQRVAKILYWTQRGVPVSKVKALLAESEETQSHETDTEEAHLWSQQQSKLCELALSFCSHKIDNFLNQCFVDYSSAVVATQLVEPVMALLEKQSGAAFQFLQSEWVKFVVIRIASGNKAISSKQLPPLLLIAGSPSPIWRLMALAIQLSDAGRRVTCITLPCDMSTWIPIVKSEHGYQVVLYQDGHWKEDEISRLNNEVQAEDSLTICGAAAVIAELESHFHIYSNPQQLLSGWLQ